MAKTDTDFIHDPIIQMMACNPKEYTKTDILDCANHILKKRPGSTRSFMTRYEGTVIEKVDTVNNTPSYYLTPEAWLDIMKALPEADFRRMANKLETHRSHTTWSRFYTEDKSTVVAFVSSFYLFLHGQPFEETAGLVGFPHWADTRYMTNTNAMRSVSDIAFYRFLGRLADIPSTIPYMKCTGSRLQDWLTYRFKQRILKEETVSDEALNAFFAPGDAADEKKNELAGFAYLYLHFLRDGDLKKALATVNPSTNIYRVLLMIGLVQSQQYSQAVTLFHKIIRGSGRHFLPDNPLANFYYAIALYLDRTASAIKKTGVILRGNDLYNSGNDAVRIILSRKDQDDDSEDNDYFTERYSESELAFCTPLERTLYSFTLIHFRLLKGDGLAKATDYIRRRALQGLKLLNVEMSNDFDFLKAEQSDLEKTTGMHPSLPYIRVVPPWEKVLDKLIESEVVEAKQDDGKKGTAQHERVTYLLNRYNLHVQPRLQKSRDGINWTSGRNIALKKFVSGDDLPLTDQDRRVAAQVSEYSSGGWYGSTYLELHGGAAVNALVGHPLVFDDSDPSSHIDIVSDKLQLSVTRGNDGFTIKSNVNTADMDTSDYVVNEETPQLLKVVKVSSRQRKILQMLRTIGTFPQEAQAKLTTILEAFSHSMVVMSDLLKDTNLKTVDADSRIVFRLQPSDDEIAVQLLVKPFTKCPPYMHPTEGLEIISTTYQGEGLQTHRDMKAEKENLDRAIGILEPLVDEQGDGQWLFTIEGCLDLLDTLRQHPDDGIVEWPEGARFTVKHGKLMPSAMKLTVNSMASWFDISGNIQIGEGEKMKIAELMDKVRQAKGHFIQLAGNDYVAISDQLRRQLAALDKMGQQQKGHLRIAAYNAPALDEMEKTGINVKADDHYRDFVKRVEESGDLKVRVPRNINAELRDYQKEGYVWMSRLAYWGAGALLADDMGLGKTLQTITELLSRAKEGAALVVVPTSLILNWRDELARFAPGLNVKILNQAGDSRSEMVQEAKAFDVVITTYGLLINEQESLCGREWNTIVLDEAHTIKNRDTKMSKAAMKLKGAFRILLTGTPVQNNLSEIWNLMQFANPNLLGSFQQFSDRFITPIEKLHDKGAQRVLRRIISPFILRRTKNDVLNELPEKTEVTRKVQLSPEEWALYDNIRQKALVNLADGDATPLQTLTELTRLRQAACNAQLIDKKLKIPSSKEAVFLEMVDSLHDNHHRALVFSQFTSHLALIRKALDKRGVEYLYLDGATPAKERDRLVHEFQTGDMPLFLISLKAGGLGLNLTAADYVIHLDPWWNPAIEEQASDRAYRIGQQNPVTVYRLIAEGTIEEKIIQLHQSKQSLADALLEGGDLSAKLSKDELLKLLKGDVL